MTSLAELGEISKAITDEQVAAYKRQRNKRLAASAASSAGLSSAATLGINMGTGHSFKRAAKPAAIMAPVAAGLTYAIRTPNVIRQNKRIKEAQQLSQQPVTKADAPPVRTPGMTDKQFGQAMAKYKAQQRKAQANAPRTYTQAEHTAGMRETAQRVTESNKTALAAERARGVRHMEKYKGRYGPGIMAQIAGKKMPKKVKAGIVLGAAGTAALASPWSHSKKESVRTAPAGSRERNKRAAVGAGVGAGGAYGGYVGASYGLNRAAGIGRYGGRDVKQNFQAEEIGRHMKKHGVVNFSETEQGKTLKEGSRAYQRAKYKHMKPQWGKLYRANAEMPHHIQGSGAARLANRMYGPSPFGRKAGLVLGTGALTGAAFGHGIKRREAGAEPRMQEFKRKLAQRRAA